MVYVAELQGISKYVRNFQTYCQLKSRRTESMSNSVWIGSIRGSLLLIANFVAEPMFDAGYARKSRRLPLKSPGWVVATT